MQDSEITVIKQNPELLKDPKLFKLILLPSELFVLKYFLMELHPINIREIYRIAIAISFNVAFNPHWEQEFEKASGGKYNLVNRQLTSEGYGIGFFNEAYQVKIMKEFLKKSANTTEAGLAEVQYKILQEHKVKVLSYDKIQNIISRLESRGVLYKRGKEGKGIVYALNTKFYEIFKDKIPEILAL